MKKDFEELSKHPLFLTDLPDNPEDNEMLRAMQALRFEGSSDDVASEFLVLYFPKIIFTKRILQINFMIIITQLY